jgi:hypothetical protein
VVRRDERKKGGWGGVNIDLFEETKIRQELRASTKIRQESRASTKIRYPRASNAVNNKKSISKKY